MKQKRSAEFKSKVAFEALKENHTLNEIGSEFKVYPLQVGKWKRQLQEEANHFFLLSENGFAPILDCLNARRDSLLEQHIYCPVRQNRM